MKLKDIKTVYCAFNDYTRSEYITTEETTALLTEAVNHSRLIKNAVVIMDGFTGFTPVQYRLLQALLELTSKVIITITIDIDSSPYSMRGEQELFYLSKKTIKDIQMLSQQVNIRQDKDVLFKTALRYSENPELDHLQKHIFRYPIKKYDRPVENIVITENNNIRDEINDVCLKIKELVLEKGYAYRDMAIVCADLDSYADIFDECAQIHDIPFFIDRNGKLKLNPFVEFILSALMIIKENYSYRSVMHFLRSGLCYAEREDIDEFDNYILKHGIKGRSRYAKLFAGVDGKTEEGADELEILNKVNEIRRSLMEGLEGLLEKPKCASDYTKALRKLISYYGIEEKLSEMKSVFDSSFEREKASEYAQVYSLIMGLLSQIDDLLSDMPISLEEFTAILRSGIEEIDIGRIPGGIDRVIVGDITRSRISNIKILFFTGVNDGNIPLSNSKGGIISDIDREFLKEKEIELSPTPRQQIYIQRLYLYMIMSKPAQKLFLSYSRTGNDGSALRESYLILLLRDIFPRLLVIKNMNESRRPESLSGIKDALQSYSDALCEYSAGTLDGITKEELAVLGTVLESDNECNEIAKKLVNAAFFEYKHKPLSKELASKLYGKILTNSVSRLEQFALCQYAHFLKYGLKLKEREEFSFERSDLGTVYHEILSDYSGNVSKSGYTLENCPDEISEKLLSESVERVCGMYGSTILYSTFSNRFTVKRIHEIMTRTVKTIKKQLSSGKFVPEGFETDFLRKIMLSDEGQMRIRGRIDRLDICKKDGKLYIKIIDYKSGTKDIELDSLLYGLQLQQPVYMAAAINEMANKYPDLIPVMAAMFYYHIDDPLLTDVSLGDDEKTLEDRIEAKLRPSGLVNSDRDIIESLDEKLTPEAQSVVSGVIPVSTLKNGELSKNSKVIDEKEYQTIFNYTDNLIGRFAHMIVDGQKQINPILKQDTDACRYCDYREVCIFDSKCNGYEHRKLQKLSREEALERMKEECL